MASTPTEERAGMRILRFMHNAMVRSTKHLMQTFQEKFSPSVLDPLR